MTTEQPQLNEEQLDAVAGGPAFLKLQGVEGESLDRQRATDDVFIEGKIITAENY